MSSRQLIIKKKTFGSHLVNGLVRVLVVLLLAAVLYYELRERNNLSDIGSVFLRQLNGTNGWWLCAAFLLMPLNWLIEVQKWQPFVHRYEPMSQWQAMQAVLAGTTFALFTPNRVGEYGGRLLFVRPENHWKALIANVVGSFAQYVVLFTGGALGGLWFAGRMLGWSEILQAKMSIAAILLVAGVCFFYFNIVKTSSLASRIPIPKRFRKPLRYLRVLKQFSRRELAIVLGWSVLRYVIYSTQYLLLLQFFGIKTGILAGYSGIATIFLLQTVVPLPAIAGLLVRGNLAVFVWSHFGANDLSSLVATFVLWIINLILPALIGTFSLFYVNIAKSLGYDDK